MAHVEAGRRSLSRSASQQLNQLAALLPAPLGEGPPVPEEPTAAGPLDPKPLLRRQRKCRWKAANLRQDLAKLDARTRRAQLWQQVLPKLRAAVPLAPADGAPDGRPQRWLDTRAAEALDHLDGTAATMRALLRLRIEHLEAEAVQLGQLLAARNE